MKPHGNTCYTGKLKMFSFIYHERPKSTVKERGEGKSKAGGELWAVLVYY